MSTTNLNAHFGQYLALLKTLYPGISGLTVFDRDASLIWQDCDNPVDQEQLHSLAHKVLRSGIDSQIQHLLNGDIAELIKLKTPNGEETLVLSICGGQPDREPMQTIAAEPAFTQLSEMLLADYQQNIELAFKEDELIMMTDELTRRYEELNLVYKAEDQAVNIYHGRELLRQLLLNTSRFLNVDIAYLYISGQIISMHKSRNDNPVFHSEALFECLRDVIHPLLEANPTPVVANQAEEWHKLGISTELPFKFVVSPVLNADGKAIGLLATANQDFAADDFSNSDRNLLDVMSKKASKIAQSNFDSLTGLENKHSFETILKDLLRQSRDHDMSHAIANIDIDRLSVVNDISGHETGDQLIKMVAHNLSEMVPDHGLVARLDSDKFGVLLKNCDLKTAEVIMRKVSHGVSSLELECEGKRHEISISIGIAPINSETQSVLSLLDAAEAARNLSKQRGRNNIHVLEIEDDGLLRRKEEIRWVGRIQEALRDGHFRLYAQLIEPLQACSSHQHHEILLRLQDEAGNIVAPGEFLPAAERFFLMSSLDQWVINQAFHELADMHRGPCKRHCKISINLSGQSLSDPFTLASYIENKLEEYGLDAHDICFEITESAAIANLEEAAAFIEQIRELGCKFALDDFGTGLSSFSYLKNLKVDYLKIDGAFVRDIARDPVSESMVAAIHQVGHAMQLETVAEYVESDEIRQKLISIGVDYGQGYDIGKPMPFCKIKAELARTG